MYFSNLGVNRVKCFRRHCFPLLISLLPLPSQPQAYPSSTLRTPTARSWPYLGCSWTKTTCSPPGRPGVRAVWRRGWGWWPAQGRVVRPAAWSSRDYWRITWSVPSSRATVRARTRRIKQVCYKACARYSHRVHRFMYVSFSVPFVGTGTERALRNLVPSVLQLKSLGRRLELKAWLHYSQNRSGPGKKTGPDPTILTRGGEVFGGPYVATCGPWKPHHFSTNILGPGQFWLSCKVA